MKTENMGWQCPNCLVVYAPKVEKCECSVVSNEKIPLPENYISFSGFGTAISRDTWAGTANCSGYISNSPNGVCSRCGNPKWNHYNISYT